jgi:tripartite-type tricarboxylate transporter receptor subunit TctC
MNKLKKRNKIILAVVIAVIITAAVLIALKLTRDFEEITVEIPERLVITVAWNPGSVSDDAARVIAPIISEAGVPVTIRNVVGSHGARGLNAVFAENRGADTHLLSTSLSAFSEAFEMGFADSEAQQWDFLVIARSPLVIAVAADSPLSCISELSGRREADTTAGSASAIAAILSGDADYAHLLSVEAAARVNAGELRILSIVNHAGESYGLFFPANLSPARRNGLEQLIVSAVASPEFAVFLEHSGLEPVTTLRLS